MTKSESFCGKSESYAKPTVTLPLPQVKVNPGPTTLTYVTFTYGRAQGKRADRSQPLEVVRTSSRQTRWTWPVAG